MSRYIKVAIVGDIPPGKMKEYKVDGITLAVANSGGTYHAFDGICTHAYCSLAGGFLDGTTLTCYCHGTQFDIKTGKVLAPPATEPLRIYKVKIEGHDITVEL